MHNHSNGNEYCILMQIKLIFLTTVEHQLRHLETEKQQLGNGPLNGIKGSFAKHHPARVIKSRVKCNKTRQSSNARQFYSSMVGGSDAGHLIKKIASKCNNEHWQLTIEKCYPSIQLSPVYSIIRPSEKYYNTVNQIAMELTMVWVTSSKTL